MAEPVAYVDVCTEFDTDGVTCLVHAWMPYSSGAFPALSTADAAQIGIAIAVLWAIAFGLRQCRKLLEQS